MSDRRKQYPFPEFESKWQQYWLDHQTFHAPNPGEPLFDPEKPKFFVMDMFPYPSGEGLHVGHPEGYTATDILARYKRMRGFKITAFVMVRSCPACAFITPLLAGPIAMPKGKSIMPYS